MRWLYFRISVVAGSQWSKYWLTSGGILKRPLSGMWSFSQDFTWLRAGPVEVYSLCTVTRTLSTVYFQALGAELHRVSQECSYFRGWSLEKTVTGKWLCLQQCIDKICKSSPTWRHLNGSVAVRLMEHANHMKCTFNNHAVMLAKMHSIKGYSLQRVPDCMHCSHHEKGYCVEWYRTLQLQMMPSWKYERKCVPCSFYLISIGCQTMLFLC